MVYKRHCDTCEHEEGSEECESCWWNQVGLPCDYCYAFCVEELMDCENCSVCANCYHDCWAGDEGEPNFPRLLRRD